MSLSTSVVLGNPVIASGTAASMEVLLRFFSAEANVVRRPLNLSLVLDRSGSMGGTPLHHAVRAAQMVVDHLTPQDRLSVVTYDDHVDTLIAPTLVTDPDAVKRALDKVRAGGLTNLSGGWLRGCDLVKGAAAAGSINRVMLLTDGQANHGITDVAKLVAKAREIAEKEIITTTLGFGSYFNEDLLISMADAAGGNFYFIQSPDDAGEVFRIEVEGLASMVADKLSVTLEPAAGVSVSEVLNSYPVKRGGDAVVVDAGEVYGIEPRALNFTLETAGLAAGASVRLARARFEYLVAVDGGLQRCTGEAEISAVVGSAEDAAAAQPDLSVLQEAARLRIGRQKEEATKLADSGKLADAAALLRGALQRYRDQGLDQSFEFAEELELLEHYASQLERGQYGTTARKEIKDQSYQARSRGRNDLKMRALSSGSTDSLNTVTAKEGEEGDGVILTCVREGGKLRVKVVTDGYDASFNVQFPRAIRQEGARYLVEKIEVAGNGSFYRATGKIELLLRPGESRPSSGGYGGSARRSSNASLRKSTATTLADLEKTTEIGDGVLVQCVAEGSKLRARVVSDGYDPNMNMRFPRQVREVGRLFVVDEVRPSADNSYYMAFGKIKLLVQPGQTT